MIVRAVVTSVTTAVRGMAANVITAAIVAMTAMVVVTERIKRKDGTVAITIVIAIHIVKTRTAVVPMVATRNARAIGTEIGTEIGIGIAVGATRTKIGATKIGATKVTARARRTRIVIGTVIGTVTVEIRRPRTEIGTRIAIAVTSTKIATRNGTEETAILDPIKTRIVTATVTENHRPRVKSEVVIALTTTMTTTPTTVRVTAIPRTVASLAREIMDRSTIIVIM